MKVGVDYPGITTVFYCTDGAGRVLLGKRSQQTRDEQGTWEAGGGQLEFGATLEENVLREVKEEYGCTGVILEQLPARSLFRQAGKDKTHWVCTPFVIKVNPAEVKNGEPEKIEEIGWFSLDNLPTPLHSGFAQGLVMYKDYLAKYR